MYIIECTKSGICDIELAHDSAMGCEFRKSEYIAHDGEATKSLNRVMVFVTKQAGNAFINEQVEYMDDGEPEAEFKLVPVVLALK